MSYARNGVFIECWSVKTGKRERMYLPARDEIPLIARALSDKYGWPLSLGEREVSEVGCQVWHLWQKTREQVEPGDIWSELRELLLRLASPDGLGRYDGDPGRLTAYVTYIASHRLPELVGGGPTVGNVGRQNGEAETIRIRLARAAGRVSDEDVADPSISALAEAWGVPDPLMAAIDQEAQQHRAELIRVLHLCFPFLAVRLARRGLDAYPAAREARRRETNPHRARVSATVPRYIRTDARRRCVLAGVRRWEALTGIPIATEVRDRLVSAAVNWRTAWAY